MRASISSSLAPHTDFALRSYRDGDEHYDGQIGSEPTPADFLRALWAVMDECWRVLKPTGVAVINLGDKYAGSGGHNNSGISDKSTLRGNGHVGGVGRAGPQKIKATRRSAPDRYNQATDVRAKSVMGLPWRFALGLSIPDPYRTCYDPGDHPQWINRRPLCWDKPNGLPESVTDRPRASSEDWFILTKQGRYFAAIDEIREGHQNRPFSGIKERHHESPTHGAWARGASGFGSNPLGKLPGSVWSIPSEPLIVPEWAKEKYNLPDHFAAFPQEWPRRLILAFSPNGICVECGEGRRPMVDKKLVGVWHDKPPQATRYEGHRGAHLNNRKAEGDKMMETFGSTEATITGYACACPEPTAETRASIVLDPFAGTFTTVGVARALGRIGIGVDLSHSYCRLGRWRIEKSGHFKKALDRTWRERQEALL